MPEQKLTTREFVLADYEQARALWSKVDGIEICEGDSREDIRVYLRRNRGFSRVVEDNGVLVGAVLCGHDGRRGFIYHIAVAPAYRKRGVGQLLLKDCMRGLEAAGIKRAIILVADNNSLGRAFWLRNGWEDITGALPMARDV